MSDFDLIEERTNPIAYVERNITDEEPEIEELNEIPEEEIDNMEHQEEDQRKTERDNNGQEEAAQESEGDQGEAEIDNNGQEEAAQELGEDQDEEFAIPEAAQGRPKRQVRRPNWYGDWDHEEIESD